MPRNRNRQLSIRLSEKEIAAFEKKRAATELSKTEFLLKLLKSSKIQVYQFSDTIRSLHGELRKIGVNLNQVAHLVNSGYFNSAKDTFSKMQTAYFCTFESLKNFLDKPLLNARIMEKPPDKDGE